MNDSSTLKSILLLAANPKGTVSLRLQEEEREIKERLRLAGYGKVPINSTGATRTRDIQQAMLDFKPQIVHFTGHGAGKNGLAFEDGTGQPKLVDSDALADLFKLFSRHVECVVLNACYSQVQAEAIAQHIDYVIGMSQEIGDRAAIEFSVGFYTALGAGEPIEFAYKLGCNAIQLEGILEHLTPILFLGKKELAGVIFTLENAKYENFYTTGGGGFAFLSDSKLAVIGEPWHRIYLNQPLPSDFKAVVQFRTENLEAQFILGLGDGSAIGENYCFVMHPEWTAFKHTLAMRENITDDWDKYVSVTKIAHFLIKPNIAYQVVFERRDGNINVLVNNFLVFRLKSEDVRDINQFNYLYLAEVTQQRLIIESLIIEELN
jgi:CHAT domain